MPPFKRKAGVIYIDTKTGMEEGRYKQGYRISRTGGYSVPPDKIPERLKNKKCPVCGGKTKVKIFGNDFAHPAIHCMECRRIN